MGLRVTLMGVGGSTGVPHIGGADGSGDWGVCDPHEQRNIRLRSSTLLENTASGEILLIDTSPDLREQMLANRVKRVDAVLYTHSHADHVLGIDDLRQLNRIIGRPLDAFGTKVTLDELRARFAYAFRPWKPPLFFSPALIGRDFTPGDVVRVAGLDVVTFDQDHGFMRSLGLRCGAFGYSTDAVDLDDAAFAALEGVDTWVVGCFQHRPHKTHAWTERVLGWVDRLKPRRTILTHMGIDMDFAALVRELPPGVEPAFDGMVLDFQ